MATRKTASKKSNTTTSTKTDNLSEAAAAAVSKKAHEDHVPAHLIPDPDPTSEEAPVVPASRWQETDDDEFDLQNNFVSQRPVRSSSAFRSFDDIERMAEARLSTWLKECRAKGIPTPKLTLKRADGRAPWMEVGERNGLPPGQAVVSVRMLVTWPTDQPTRHPRDQWDEETRTPASLYD